MKAIEYGNIMSSMEYNGCIEAPAGRGPAEIAAELYSV